MPSEQRQGLIRRIERKRGSRLLTYVTGDRAPVPANIGDDAVRPIIEHLRAMGHSDKLDLFIYSRGGAIDVPWRIANSLRSSSDTWSALVPFRANSAATLLCIGADSIVMGPQAELGPIDPIMSFNRHTATGPEQENLAVEDIMAFAKFLDARFDLKSEESRSLALAKLVDRVDAVTLGSAYRTHTHIRYLAKKMLNSRCGDHADGESVERIVRTLAEEVYAHGHAIGLNEATEIGLPVTAADGDLDSMMWDLLQEYEKDMKLLEPLDPFAVVQAQDRYAEEVSVAVVESAGLTHEFRGQLDVQAQRQMPQNLQMHLNVPIQLPPGVDMAQLPQALQQMLQSAQQAILQGAQQVVQEELKRQAPLVGCQVRVIGGVWRKTGGEP